MTKKPKSESKQAILDPDKVRCENPRYGDMTVAEATRKFMQSGVKPKEPDKKR